MFEKIDDFKNLLEKNFETRLMSIVNNEGKSNLIKGRFCMLHLNNLLLVYVTSPPITEICEPEWRNKVTLLTCNVNNESCTTTGTFLIDNFEENYRIEPNV